MLSKQSSLRWAAYVGVVSEGSIVFTASFKPGALRGTLFEYRTVLTNSEKSACPDVTSFLFFTLSILLAVAAVALPVWRSFA